MKSTITARSKTTVCSLGYQICRLDYQEDFLKEPIARIRYV